MHSGQRTVHESVVKGHGTYIVIECLVRIASSFVVAAQFRRPRPRHENVAGVKMWLILIEKYIGSMPAESQRNACALKGARRENSFVRSAIRSGGPHESRACALRMK